METRINGDLLKEKIGEFGGVTAFAAAVGVSRIYIYRVINGEVPSVDRLAQFADLLGVTLDDLVVVESPKDPALAAM